MIHAHAPTRTVLLAGLLASVACGPSRASSAATDPSDDSTTTSGETGESETSDGPTTTSEGPFVPDFDLIGHLCDAWKQDCPEGEKCVPYASTGESWDSVTCVPITGDQGPGEPCVSGGVVDATDDCRADSICWEVEEVDGQLVGQCVVQCAGTPDVPICPENYACTVWGEGVLRLCLRSCDPLLQDCDEGLGCYWDGDRFGCVPEPEGGGVGPGQPCGLINDCAPGSVCVPSAVLPDCASGSCCAPFCPLSGGDEPCVGLPGTSCVTFFREGSAPPEYEELGVCVLP